MAVAASAGAARGARRWRNCGGKWLVTMLNQDFKEFAALLNSNRVDYPDHRISRPTSVPLAA